MVGNWKKRDKSLGCKMENVLVKELLSSVFFPTLQQNNLIERTNRVWEQELNWAGYLTWDLAAQTRFKEQVIWSDVLPRK